MNFLFQTEIDFLSIIDILVAKGIRKMPENPIRTQVNRFQHQMLIMITVNHENAEKMLTGLIKSTYLRNITDNIDLVAKVMLKENESFDVTSTKFWRSFLRFKHLKKLLLKISEEDEPTIEEVEKVMSRILGISNIS